MDTLAKNWDELLDPTGFPTVAWRRVLDDLVTPWHGSAEFWSDFAGGWLALAYRWRACFDANDAFVASVREHGETPTEGARYQQERLLYEFFISGLSVFESYAYALHAICSVLDASSFPLTSDAHRRAVSPAKLGSRLKASYPKEKLTITLGSVLDSAEYQRWSSLRNVLAHRVQPGRTIVAGGSSLWLSGPLVTATATRFAWLQQQVAGMIPLTESFVAARLPRKAHP
jgi:hypothetical protein